MTSRTAVVADRVFDGTSLLDGRRAVLLDDRTVVGVVAAGNVPEAYEVVDHGGATKDESRDHDEVVVFPR